jgi:hypothetical protein
MTMHTKKIVEDNNGFGEPVVTAIMLRVGLTN